MTVLEKLQSMTEEDWLNELKFDDRRREFICSFCCDDHDACLKGCRECIKRVLRMDYKPGIFDIPRTSLVSFDTVVDKIKKGVL